jgi:trehalose-phosphatase
MIQSPAEVFSEVKDRIKTAERLSLFLDFDGTLVPIEADPTKPTLDETAAEILRLLSGRESPITTIISGRAVEDLYSRIRLEGLIYAGNHGLEIFGRGLHFTEPAAADRRKELEEFCENLTLTLRPFAGALVEYKGLTASVHYRRAANEDVLDIWEAVSRAVARSGALFRVNSGNKVFEILPRTDWHKGAAVHWINSQFGNGEVLSIYVGDDTTDEDAFCVLPDAITIRVGDVSATRARYQFADPAAVHEFLMWLAVDASRLPAA